ncbi:MAG TPA: hypothetical protein VFT72_07340 [Opitutaceae bacterium]|nr:hypothetical protein [Opitutaceae bacterium]
MDSNALRPDSSSIPRRLFRSALFWLALALIGYGIFIFNECSWYIGGSDSSGYYNSAQLLASGRATKTLRVIPGLSPADHRVGPELYIPLGFRAITETEMVPTYPVGLPLMILLAAPFTGWIFAPGWAAGINMFFGAVVSYALGRECGLSRWMSLIGAALVGLGPLYVFMGLQPMTDVASLTWETAALLFTLMSRRRVAWTIAAGFCIGISVLLRPANLMLVIPVAVMLGFDVRRWAALALGGLPCAAFLAWYNFRTYGVILTTGYGNLSSEFSPQWIVPTLGHYAVWLPILFSPVVLLALGLPWVCRDKRLVVTLGSWVLLLLSFYATYRFTHFVWWFLRFILPVAPILVVSGLLVLTHLAARLAWRQSTKATVAVALGLCIGTIYTVCWRKFHVTAVKHVDRTYLSVAEWFKENAPANSVIATMQNSGSLIAYTDFTMLRWDEIMPPRFELIRARLAQTHQPLYLAALDWEAKDAFKRMPGQWKKHTLIYSVEIWEYLPETVTSGTS